MKKKLKAIAYLPPSVMFYMFYTLIQPILSYGSAIWGVRKTGCSAIDNVFFSLMKHTLYVKQSTSNIITIGECGQIPPSVVCHTNFIKYIVRVSNMNDCHIVKQVYNELFRLHEVGFIWCINIILTSLVKMVTLRYIVNHSLKINSERTGNSTSKMSKKVPSSVMTPSLVYTRYPPHPPPQRFVSHQFHWRDNLFVLGHL